MSRKTRRNRIIFGTASREVEAQELKVFNRFNPQYFFGYLFYRYWQHFAAERNPVLPLVFAFLGVGLCLYFNYLALSYLLRPWVDLHFTPESWGLLLSKDQKKLWALAVYVVIDIAIYPVLFYKNRYVTWFESFDAESEESRLRGTLVVFCYLLLSVLLFIGSIMAIGYRRDNLGLG